METLLLFLDIHTGQILQEILDTYLHLETRAQIFVLVALTLTIISTMLIVILYTRRSFMTMREKRIGELKFRFQYLIYDSLVESQSDSRENTTHEVIVNKLKSEIAKSNLHKEVLIDLIIDLKKNFTGHSEKQFTNLYHALNLPKYSLKKLRDSRWDVQAKGIKELSEIGYNSPKTQAAISRLELAKNTSVAQEAQAASIRIKREPLQFLKNLETPLTEWQQINLHNILLKIDKRLIPDFSNWLDSENTSVVVFSLRMIADFKQKNATPVLKDYLYHKSPDVREQTIMTMIQMHLSEYTQEMIEASISCGKDTILLVLNATEKWNTIRYHDIPEELTNHVSPEVSQKVSTLLLKLSPETSTDSSHLANRTF